MYVGLAGGLEAVAMLVVMPVTQRLGRRLVMGVGPPLCGSLLVANLFVPEGGFVFLSRKLGGCSRLGRCVRTCSRLPALTCVCVWTGLG